MPGKLVGPSLGGECAVGVGVMLLETFLAGRGSRLPLLSGPGAEEALSHCLKIT